MRAKVLLYSVFSLFWLSMDSSPVAQVNAFINTAVESSCGDGWRSWKSRPRVSLAFQNRPLKDVAEEIVRQSDLTVPVGVSILLEKRRISGTLQDLAFWEAIVKVAQLADAEFAVKPLDKPFRENDFDYRLEFFRGSSTLIRKYAFVGPFCFELARLDKSANPDVIKNTWRLRSVGLREDGDTALFLNAVIHTEGEDATEYEWIPISDYGGDIIRSGNTHDSFLRIPSAIESRGFRISLTANPIETSQWRWVTIPLKAHAKTRIEKMLIEILGVTETPEEIHTTYAVSWPTELSAEAIEKYRIVLKAGTKLEDEDIQWINLPQNRTPITTIKDYLVVENDRSRTVSDVVLSKRHSGNLLQPGITGEVVIKRASLPKNPGDLSLKIQIARRHTVDREFQFRVEPLGKKASRAK